ncbi:MAG: hypothetical protein LBR93_10665 [Treponema sp.]|nr:hypothetical protein [Treponema sp.]
MAFLPAAFLVLFLAACGEMDTILPSSVTYQVSALVGQTSLENYSVVGKDDAVQPVFISPVTGDPDLTGLLVYLQSPEGGTVGGKVYYLLKTAEDPAEDSSQGPARDETQGPAQEENTETAKDTPPKEEIPGKAANETPIPARARETLIQVSRLDKDLPAFPFPENLKIGAYSLVFETLGEKQTLYRTERHIYYIGDAEFSLGDIQSYLPGVSAGSYLIPPGFAVMLETQVRADEKLDPYIVWYDGKRRIAGGRIADGTGRLLWEAPAQTGFHTIRAELFPFDPASVSSGTGNFRTSGRSSAPELRGKVKELALPVSAKGGKPAFSVPQGGEVLHWYQFAGNLRDSMANGGKGKDLSGSGGQDLRWVPSGGIYGLSVKTGDTYQLPRLSFAIDGEKGGGGSFLLRVKPMTEGTLLSASFKAAGSPGDALTMAVVYQERSLHLTLESGGLKAAGSLALDMFLDTFPENSGSSAQGPALNDFITVEAGFYVRENTFTAALIAEGNGEFRVSGLFQADSSAVPETLPNSAAIELSKPLSGEISCRLGTSREQASRLPDGESLPLTAEKRTEDTVSAAEPAVSAEEPAQAEPGPFPVQAPTDREPSPLAIFDELALIFRNPVQLSNK